MPGTVGVPIITKVNRVSVVVFKKNSTSCLLRALEELDVISLSSSCADISISSPAQESETSLLDFPLIQPNAFASEGEPGPMPIPQHTDAVDFAYPFAPSNEILTRERILHCYPTNEVLKPVLGIEKWCEQLCLTECPPTLCVCVKIPV